MEVVKIKVTIIVSADAVHPLHNRCAPTSASQKLLKIAEKFGVVLEPMHPGSEDPLLDPYFIAEVPDSGAAERLVTHLRRSKATEAAYIKPPDELP